MGENSRHTNLRRTVLRSLQGAWAQHFPNLHIPSSACPVPRLASILQQSLYPSIFSYRVLSTAQEQLAKCPEKNYSEGL